MYDDLVKRLRDAAKISEALTVLLPHSEGNATAKLYNDAADAIEELSRKTQELPRWIPFETRPMDAEEREYYSEHYGYELSDDEAVIYCCEMPDHDQEVLVCNKYGSVWIDRFDDDPDYGVGFETNGDMDGLVAWMPRPNPYKLPKEGDVRE